jgi:hypothetical protein
MYKRLTKFAVGFTCAAALLLCVGAPAMAQDTPDGLPAPADATAATATLGEVSAVLVTDEADADAGATAKQGVQETLKSVPSGEGSDPPDSKILMFLPQLNNGAAVSTAETDEVTAYWRNIKIETFEGAFPNGLWRAYDANGTTGGHHYWDDDDYKPYSGRWSAWPARAGLNGRDPQYYYYPNNARSWMVYGPFSLRYAQSARLFFRYWNQSERNYDYLAWMYSCNGTNFYGTQTSGDSAGWQYRYLSIPCLRDSSVWIAFRFTSDGSRVDDGAFVDNVYIQEYR